MNIKNYFKVPVQSNFASLALLFLRVVAGLAFMYHGWSKIQNPFGWMPAESPVPGILQALAALSEFGGGLALILGLLIPLASLGLICTMAVATLMHAFVMKDPFVNMTGSGGSFEPALGYLAIAFVILAVGPGKYSADAKIFGLRTK